MLLTINIAERKYEELSAQEKTLIDAAKAATDNSYSPYSHFCVGAAVLLDDGTIYQGANQENAAYSVTICAERTAIFAAQAAHPEKAITAIAIAARGESPETATTKAADGNFSTNPVSPCGSCRQVIFEMEKRYKRDIKVLMYGTDTVYIADTIKDLLPFGF